MNPYFLVTPLVMASTFAFAGDLAYKQMPHITGRPVGTIYLERGPHSSCPDDVPDSDTMNFWAGGRLTQGDEVIRICWFTKDKIISILQPYDGKQIKIAAVEFTYLSQPAVQSNKKKTPQAVRSDAASNSERNGTCMNYASMFESIAEWRDSGQRPEFTLERISYFQEIPLVSRKQAINMIYFDPAFSRARGSALVGQIFHTCLYGPTEPFKPLK